MNNKKQTKKALCMSVLSMVLCVAMLVGMTFAWFTDTASTAVNQIQAGKLKVTLVDAEGNSLTGKTLAWKKAAGHETEAVLWEPGCTYELQDVYVKNEGNLALKYKIAITGIKGDEKLNEVIDWTISDNTFDANHSLAAKATSDALTIKGHMQESAGNKYQGMSIDGIAITVYATQDTVEYDSNNNQYDATAEYDSKNIYFADSAASLKAAAAKAQAGDEIKLGSDITLSETVTFEASKLTLDGNGHTITADMSENDVENLKTVLRFGHDTTYCTGVTIKNINFRGNGGRAMHFHGGTSSVLENVTVSGNWSLPINFYGTHGAVMTNCSISSSYENKYAKSSIFANEQSANQIILNNTTIDSIFVNATENGATYANNGIKVVVNSGSKVNVIHTNKDVTRTFYEVNGGTVSEVLADIE